MSHGIARTTDAAFNIDNGVPWHRLGTRFHGNQPLKVMLETVGADFHAYKAPALGDGNLGLATTDEFVAIQAERPIGKDNAPKTQIFAFMGSGYEIVQYDFVAERAVHIAGESDGAAIFDGMGLLYDGKRYFATLDLGELIIDPAGINDKVERWLLVYTSHDGSVSVTYVNGSIRTVCKNTIDFAIANAHRMLKAKHTSQVDARLEKQEVQRVLGFSTEWAEAFRKEAEKLLAVTYTPVLMDRMLEVAFPSKSSATKREENNVESKREHVRAIFENDRNAAGFGKSGWTMYNAMAEYLDHGRSGTADARALASMTPNSWVDKLKTKTAKFLLASKN